MSGIRKAVVAGSFYPDNPRVLRESIESYLVKAALQIEAHTDILGIISPHAGYVYSGQCAAYAFKALQEKDFDLAVIIAPSHQYGDFFFSVGDFEAYETPLGKVEVERELAGLLLQDANFVFYPYAHNQEHSLEVQLPFLQTINPKAKILPVLIGQQYDKSSEYLSNILTPLIKERVSKTVVIVSSDLSHYHNAKQAEQLDNQIINAINNLDEDLVWNLIKEKKAEACGFGGVMTIMNLAKQLNYGSVQTLCYTHSGKTSGDNSQVVGYLSSLFYL